MPEEKKFDFQNIDVKLYLALRNLTKNAQWVNDTENMVYNDDGLIKAAELAMEEFELSHGPVPDWATARNWDYSLVPGAQLCTKDGRRTGNAHIIKVRYLNLPEETVLTQVFECLTDAGSKITFTEVELLGAFSIGDWISDPQRVLKDFDHNDEFMEQPDE